MVPDAAFVKLCLIIMLFAVGGMVAVMIEHWWKRRK